MAGTRNAIPRADGRGGTVDARICRVTPGEVTEEQVRDMADTFATRRKPSSIWWSHDTSLRRSRDGKMPTPALGTIRGVWLEGDELWGDLALGREAWAHVVEEPGFDGFSVEADRPTPRDRWVLTGGVITNYPKADIRFAAEEGEDDRIVLRAEGAMRTAEETVLDKAWDLAAERGIGLGAAIDAIKAESPALWKKAMSERSAREARKRVALQAPQPNGAAVSKFIAECMKTSGAENVSFERALDLVRMRDAELWAEATAHYRK